MIVWDFKNRYYFVTCTQDVGEHIPTEKFSRIK